MNEPVTTIGELSLSDCSNPYDHVRIQSPASQHGVRRAIDMSGTGRVLNSGTGLEQRYCFSPLT